MPIIPMPPPPGALVAFSDGLAWLREVEDRFRRLEPAREFDGESLPPSHAVNFIGLDLVVSNTRRIWRFFVANKAISLGVIDVIPVGDSARSEDYEFLAFREGPPITAMARAYRQAEVFSGSNEWSLESVNMPAIGTKLFWLSERLPASPWLEPEDYALAIPPRLRGFEERPIPAARAFDLIVRESARVQASPFVQALARSDSDGFDEPPPTATAG